MKGWRLICLVVMLFVGQAAVAQYYSWGADAPMRWQELRNEGVRVIAPDTAEQVARRVLHYVEAVRPYVAEGFSRGPLDIPFILHPENMESNAIVMYLPKRVDYLSSPAVASYSMPWTKQLVAHEYRHAVQYNNLKRGVPRVLSWFLGQQGTVTSLLFMPLWAVEGDAVMNETAMSTYGRGLQPSFSMGYRAIGDQIGLSHRGKKRKNIDRWFCGSYRDYIPDHYELGYQMSAYAYDRYGENVWNKVGRYAVRNPYVFATTHVGLKRYYDTTTNELFYHTFESLNRHWKPLAEVEENHRPLVAMDSTNYTTYRWPLQLTEAEVVAVKTDLARAARIVTLDSEGNEREVAGVGYLSTRPACYDGKLYWSEYEASTLYEERVRSQLWMLDFNGDKQRPVRLGEVKGNALYPTPSERGLAWVEYRPEGRYLLMENGEQICALPIGVELHGLAWDEVTKAYYTLLTSDDGMALARLDHQGVHPLQKSAFVTLSDLRAEGGQLYFGSIRSGKDEVHRYDLATGTEYRLSESKYGAFAPAPSPWGMLLTSYDRRGYAVARISEPMQDTVQWSALPENRVNPAWRTWQTINLDTVRYTPSVATEQQATHPAKRYRKFFRGVNLHSWAPVAFDPFETVDEHTFDPNIGVTLLSQNLLSNTEAYASYGWDENEQSIWKIGVRNNSLGVQLGLDATYGGMQQVYSVGYYDRETEKYIYQPLPSIKDYFSVTASATLPLLFDRGRSVRRLTLGVGWNYSNGQVADFDAIEWEGSTIRNLATLGYNEGLHKLTFSLSFAEQLKMAHRDFLPRLGYQVMVGHALNPTNRDFAGMQVFYGGLYLPGLGAHHSIQLEASCQFATGGYRFPSGMRPLTYRSSVLTPRGYASSSFSPDDEMTTLSVNYRLPLCYPEWGIPSVLYIKRIRLGMGYDMAAFRYGGRAYQPWSAGGELAFDFNVLRMPSSATSTFTLKCFYLSNRTVWYAASLGLPF